MTFSKSSRTRPMLSGFSMLAAAVTFLAVLVLSLPALAQFETGSISGTVKDSSGAIIAGAQVTITAASTNAERTETSNDDGFYNVTNLQPGLYEVRVSHPNFGTYTQKITVSPGSHGSIDATLELKGTTTTIEVVEHSETTVDTTSSSITQVISAQSVAQLPSLTRDPYDFVQTLGNVNQDSASGTGGSDQVVRGAGVAIGGQRSASTDSLLDGGENVDLYTSKVGQSVPLDAVQELSVTSSNFSAEYGRASGGVINVVTKSGSNAFHGSLYEFNRLSKLTSNDFDSNSRGLPKQVFTRNQFGYSLGGPIKKEKLFFFSSTEWTRVRSSANIVAAVPDDAFLAASAPATQAIFNAFAKRPSLRVLNQLDAGASQALPTINPHNDPTDPTATNPIQPSYYAYACNAAAPGTTPDCVPNGNPVFDIVSYSAPSDAGGGAPQNTYNTFNRVDFNLTDKTTLFVRYDLLNQSELAGFVNNSPYVGFDTGQTQFNQNALFSLTHIWNSHLVSDTKINVNRLNLQQALNAAQPVQPTLYFNANFDVTVQGNPTCLVGYSCTTPGNSIPFGGPQNVMQFAQALSWNKGKHDFRFGGSYVYTRDNRTFGAYQNAVQALEPGGNGTVPDGFENLINGNAGWFQVVIDPQGKFPCSKDSTGAYIVTPDCSINLPAVQPSFSRNNRYHDFAFYGQDSWKVSSRLTLNLGLRWEYYGVQHNGNAKLDSNFVYGTGSNLFDKIRNGQVYTVDATTNSPASPVGGLWHKQFHNFGPRVGFAYDVFGDGKTSLRGGYGIAYERNFGNVTFNVIQNPPGQFNSIFQSGAQPIESGNLGPFAGATGTKFLPNPSLRYVRQDIPTAYSESWNLSLQRQLFSNSLFAVEYTGSHGVHLYSIENLNQRGFGVIYEGTDPVVDNSIDRLNRQYGNMNTRGTNGFSHYNALNTRFVTSNLYHQGLTLTVNYTYSHTIDNLSSSFSETPQTENLGLLDPFQPALDKGSADFDARHRIAFSGVWTPPYASGLHGVAKQVLDGWEIAPIITAHTGNPFTVFDSTNNIGDTVSARYVVPTGTRVSLSGSTNNVDATGDFAGANTFTYLTLPASATYAEPLTGSGELPTCDMTTNAAGNQVSTGKNCRWPSNLSGRNMFHGPGAYNINAELGKTFPISERFRLQFRSEFYNLLNHSNYYVQSGSTQDVGNVGNPATFQVTGKRGVSPAAGVPNERRFIQFALKLLF